MKNVLMAVAVLFVLGGTLGFRPVAVFATQSEESIAEHSFDARYMPGLRPSPAGISKEIRFRGVILSVNLKASAINVNGTWVHISSETIVNMANSNVPIVMGIEHLVVGSNVQVYGSMNIEGTLTAFRIDF